jgi:hypothetical protein
MTPAALTLLVAHVRGSARGHDRRQSRSRSTSH